ncbi:cytochrome P450 2J6-like [Tachypleus tridentatus]|uniref:cytochrome P450 2J6-like n=1 Tax=Tachypleus tridentatus TaxID=6853 RepID=UPI003FD2E4C5
MEKNLSTGTLWAWLKPTFGTTVLFATCVFFFLCWLLGRPRNYPPGPVGLPIVGYLTFLSKKPHLDFIELSKKYGNVFSLRLGSQNVVILGDFPAIKEAMKKDAFLGRPPDPQFQVTPDFINIGIVNGRWWKEQRRFSLHVLRNLGFGKTKMEDHMKNEIGIVLEYLSSLNGAVCEVREILGSSISNTISALVFGQRFDYNDPKRIFLYKRIDGFTKFVQQFSLQTFFPWMKPFLTFIKPNTFRKFQDTTEKLTMFVRDKIDEHETSLDQNSVRDYIDSFLMEMKDREMKNNRSSFNYNMLNGNVQAFFIAGCSTVQATIQWCLLTMAAYPDVQKRVQNEMDSVIGRERLPSWGDHIHLPYTQAVLHEVQRWQTIAPLGLLRYTTEDTTVQGYDVPKGTIVINNIWAFHNDPKYWKNPSEFFPEHFLTEEGTKFEKPEYFIPFSIGKRSCPGETPAVVELFLFFTSILQRFIVALPDGDKPNFDGVFELTWEAKHHKFRFIPRS